MLMQKYFKKIITKSALFILIYLSLILVMPKLAFIKSNEYLLIHTVAESIGILIAFTIFVTSYNFRYDIQEDYILFLGILFLAVGGVDALHNFSYMGISGYDIGASQEKATILWLYSNYLCALGLLGATNALIPNKAGLRLKRHLGITLVLLCAGIVITFHKFVMPIIDTTDFTIFGKMLVALLIFAKITTSFMLYKKHNFLKPDVYYSLNMFLVTSVFSDITFLIYNSTILDFNLPGHIFKLISYYYIFKAVYKDGVLENHLLASTISRLSRNILKHDISLEQTGEYIAQAFKVHLKKPGRVAFYIKNDSDFALIGYSGKYSDLIQPGTLLDLKIFQDIEYPIVFNNLNEIGEFRPLKEEDNYNLTIIKNQVKQGMFIPLIDNSELIGFVLAYNFERRKVYGNDDIIAANSLANFAVLALSHAKMVAQMQSFSFEDVLTKLNNRRYFMERLTEMLYNGNRYERKFSLVIIDLDGMKFINDAYGHQAGDLALITVGNFLKDTFRLGDIVARLGGDEFGVIIQESSYDKSCKKMEILQQELENYKMPKFNCKLYISFGISQYPEDGTEKKQLIKIADDKMYQQKAERKKYKQIPVIRR